jgi:hypothetical protein
MIKAKEHYFYRRCDHFELQKLKSKYIEHIGSQSKLDPHRIVTQ